MNTQQLLDNIAQKVITNGNLKAADLNPILKGMVMNSGVFLFPKHSSLTDAHIGRLVANVNGVAKLTEISDAVPPTLGIWRLETGNQLPTMPARAKLIYTIFTGVTPQPTNGQVMSFYNSNWSDEYFDIQFYDSPTEPNQVEIGETLADTIENIVAWLNTNAPELSAAVNDGSSFYFYSKYAGEWGDDYSNYGGDVDASISISEYGSEGCFQHLGIIGNVEVNSGMMFPIGAPDTSAIFDSTLLPEIATLGSSFPYKGVNGDASAHDLRSPDTMEDYAKMFAAFINYCFDTLAPGEFNASASEQSGTWGVDVTELTNHGAWSPFDLGLFYDLNMKQNPTETQSREQGIPARVNQLILGTLEGINQTSGMALISNAFVSRVILADDSNPVVIDPSDPNDMDSRLLIPTADGFVTNVLSGPENQMTVSGVFLAIEEAEPNEECLAFRFPLPF